MILKPISPILLAWLRTWDYISWRHKAINWLLITYCNQLYLSRFDPISWKKKKCFPFLYSWFYFQVLGKLNTYHTLAFRAYCHLFCDIFQIWGTRIFGLVLFSVGVSVKFFQSNKPLHWDSDQTKSNQVRKRSGLMDAKAPGWPFSTHPLHWRKTEKPWRMKRRTGKVTCSFSGGGQFTPCGGRGSPFGGLSQKWSLYWDNSQEKGLEMELSTKHFKMDSRRWSKAANQTVYLPNT